MQAVADVAQLPVEVTTFEHATAAGAAAAGRLAVEPALTVAAAAPVPDVDHVLEPRWSADRAAAFRARWEQVALG
jgi:sugar (pentulose or hexulose) kinase